MYQKLELKLEQDSRSIEEDKYTYMSRIQFLFAWVQLN